MKSDIYWIETPFEGRLAICARPRGGDWLKDEVAAWKNAGLNVVVSALEPAEIEELDLMAEADMCRQAGLEFVAFPIPDRGTPPVNEITSRVLADLISRLERGLNVGIHCRQGIGRSSLIAATVLKRAGVADPWGLVEESRGRPVPDTSAQREWALHHADSEHLAAGNALFRGDQGGTR